MAYTELLSEQVPAVDLVVTGTGTNSGTGDIIDMSGYHRIMALAYVTETTTAKTTVTSTAGTTTASCTAKVKIVVNASTSSAFGGTSTTVAASTVTLSATGTATASTATGTAKNTANATINQMVAVDVSGEDVQAQRVAEDRYVRATITLTGVAGAGAGLVMADCARFKPIE